MLQKVSTLSDARLHGSDVIRAPRVLALQRCGLTTFRRRSGEFIKQLKKSERPVVLTVKGKAAAIVQDAGAYQRLRILPPRLT
jgi:prevent-host-death family protein